MQNLSALYKDIKARFKSAGIDSADLDARLIIQKRAGLEWGDIIARPEVIISSEHIQSIEHDVQKRLEGWPVSRLYGEREFWGLKFKLAPETLDPRPDTETIVEIALRRFRDAGPGRVLDLGTGSGCILIALLHEWKDCRGLGIDKSHRALETARENARANGVAGRALFSCGSWGESLRQGAEGVKFDLIVSNPPYIPKSDIGNLSKEVQNHDPILALDGGIDGLDSYKIIFFQLSGLLNKGGLGLFEIGFDQDQDVVRLAEESGLSVKDVHPDLAGLKRVVEISSGDK